jgi:hypothetical protein
VPRCSISQSSVTGILYRNSLDALFMYCEEKVVVSLAGEYWLRGLLEDVNGSVVGVRHLNRDDYYLSNMEFGEPRRDFKIIEAKSLRIYYQRINHWGRIICGDFFANMLILGYAKGGRGGLPSTG